METNADSPPSRIALDQRLSQLAEPFLGRPLVFGVRPEDLADAETTGSTSVDQTICATVDVSEPMGSETYLYLSTGAHPFIARVRPTDRFLPKQRVQLTIDLEKAHLFDAETEAVLVDQRIKESPVASVLGSG